MIGYEMPADWIVSWSMSPSVSHSKLYVVFHNDQKETKKHVVLEVLKRIWLDVLPLYNECIWLGKEEMGYWHCWSLVVRSVFVVVSCMVCMCVSSVSDSHKC
jgi:hypothetical protein